jgi:acyl homoserine lactone synthase
MRIVWGKREELPTAYFEALSYYRHRVFVEHLGWKLSTNGQEETDQFDGPDAVYGIAFDERGIVKGCARLLPTTRPYLLAEVFPELLCGEAAPCSERIWEISRFATIDLEQPYRRQLRRSSRDNTREFTEATLRYVSSLGVEQLVSVSTVGLERLLRKMGVEVRSNCPRPGSDALLGCWIDVARSRRGLVLTQARKRSPFVAKAYALETARAFDLI